MAPKIIFIIPYRDREQQLFFYKKYMNYILEDMPSDDWEMYFSHQTDKREFNRGGTKNIGFLAMKEKYPNDYKNITFVFNDIDTFPYKKHLLDYETTNGVVKHFYGFRQALGGIVSMKGGDFESINGFPNNWAWGFEDNTLQKRVTNTAILTIDRSQFWEIGNNNIIQLFDTASRRIMVNNKKKFINDNTNDGLSSIINLNYQINGDMINITTFDTLYKFNPNEVIDVKVLEERKTIRRKMFGMRSKQPQQPVQPQAPPPPIQSNAFKKNRKMFTMF